jgi:hypothetical protein
MALTSPDSAQVAHYDTTVKAALDALGGGTGSAPSVSTNIPNFSFTSNVAITELRHEVPSIPTGGWNTTSGSCVLQFEFVSTGFFTANPTAHFAVGTRIDLDLIGTAVRGAGAAFGDLRGATEGTQTNPGAQIETWSNGLAGPDYRQLIPNASSPANKPLLDGVRYQCFIETVNAPNAMRFNRMVVARENALRSAWDVEVDTGYCIDSNQLYDASKTGFVFAYVFATNVTAWTLAFENMRVTWGPAFGIADSSNVDRLSRYGDTVYGDITFAGTSRKIKLDMSVGYNNWTAFTAAQEDTGCTVMVAPRGSAVNANFLATNRGVLTSFGYVSMGMVGAKSVIETLGVGGHVTPDIEIRPGTGLAMTFKSGQVWLPAATAHLATPTAITGPTVLGGPQALIMAQNPLSYESLSTPGVIQGFTGSGEIEFATRPLYGMLSYLLAELKAKGIL